MNAKLILKRPQPAQQPFLSLIEQASEQKSERRAPEVSKKFGRSGEAVSEKMQRVRWPQCSLFFCSFSWRAFFKTPANQATTPSLPLPKLKDVSLVAVMHLSVAIPRGCPRGIEPPSICKLHPPTQGQHSSTKGYYCPSPGEHNLN